MIKIMDKIDLHIHSTYSSDGELEVLQVVGACVENRVNTFSITDHNSVRGTREAIEIARERALDFIPGIETCMSWGLVLTGKVGILRSWRKIFPGR